MISIIITLATIILSMALHQIIKENNIKIGLWKIEESLEELIQLTERISIPNCNTEKRK